MPVRPIPRKVPARAKSPLVAVSFIALALALVFVSTWAKTSRYDLHATPSAHFSTSVKVARVLFLKFNVLSSAPAIPPAAPLQVLEPSERRLTPLAEAVEGHGILTVLQFPPFRAPPLQA